MRDNLMRDTLMRDTLMRDTLMRDTLMRDTLTRDTLMRYALMRDRVCNLPCIMKINFFKTLIDFSGFCGSEKPIFLNS